MSDETKEPTPRERLAAALGLDPKAATPALYAAVHELLDIAERPGGIDPDETSEAEVNGRRYALGFVPRRKLIGWEGESNKLAVLAIAALPEGLSVAALAAVQAGDREATEAMEKAIKADPDRHERMASAQQRRNDLDRDIVRWGARGGPDSMKVETETIEYAGRRFAVLTHETVDRIEARGDLPALAALIMRHWTLTPAEKKS